MGRMEEINEKVQPILVNIFAQSLDKIEVYCEDHCKEVAIEFVEAIKHVMQRTYELQKDGEKDAVKYIVFSYLHSGMVLQQKRIRMDVMDGGFYADSCEAAFYLNLNGIYQFFEDDISTIKNELEQIIPRIYEYELDLIRYEYGMYYHRAAKQLIQGLFEEIDREFLFDFIGIKMEPCIEVLFGGYMDLADRFKLL